MDNRHKLKHLQLSRVALSPERRKGRAGGAPRSERDNVSHARSLLESVGRLRQEFAHVRDQTPLEFEPALIFSAERESGYVSEVDLRRSDLELLDEESDRRLILLSRDGLEKLENRIAQYGQELPEGQKPPYRWITDVDENLTLRTPEDRLGPKLREIDINPDDTYRVDIEFYQSEYDNADKLLDDLEAFIRNRSEKFIDSFKGRSLILARVEVAGQPIVFDMRDLSAPLQRALVGAMNSTIKRICANEAEPSGRGRFPFVFYEEAHFYISDDVIIDIITRGRHIGMGAFFVTNTPQELPKTVFRQLDNLFLLSLTHNDDIRNVSQTSFTDEATIRSFATRMPRHHGLIVGNVTSRYPIMVEIDDLPKDVPTTGRTRSTWDRFRYEE